MAAVDDLIVEMAADHARQMISLRNIHLTRRWILRQLRDPNLPEEERNGLALELAALRADLHGESRRLTDRIGSIVTNLRETPTVSSPSDSGADDS
jgi:hypothetical protein